MTTQSVYPSESFDIAMSYGYVPKLGSIAYAQSGLRLAGELHYISPDFYGRVMVYCPGTGYVPMTPAEVEAWLANDEPEEEGIGGDSR